MTFLHGLTFLGPTGITLHFCPQVSSLPASQSPGYSVTILLSDSTTSKPAWLPALTSVGTAC